jgi:hypothetical protein
MVRVNRLLILVAACGLAACDQMGTEPTLDAPVGMGRNNDNGSQFAPNPFFTLGLFRDEEGNSCSVNWGTERDQNDFIRFDPHGDRHLHVASQDAALRVMYGGQLWTGVGTANGSADFRAVGGGFDMLNFSASAKVTSAAGEEGQAVCHLQITDGLEYTKTDIRVN